MAAGRTSGLPAEARLDGLGEELVGERDATGGEPEFNGRVAGKFAPVLGGAAEGEATGSDDDSDEIEGCKDAEGFAVSGPVEAPPLASLSRSDADGESVAFDGTSVRTGSKVGLGAGAEAIDVLGGRGADGDSRTEPDAGVVGGRSTGLWARRPSGDAGPTGRFFPALVSLPVKTCRGLVGAAVGFAGAFFEALGSTAAVF